MRNFTEKLKLLITLVMILNVTWLFAGDPTWERVVYTNSTTITGEIVVNTYLTTPLPISADDYIGGFVDGECRMSTKLIENGGKYYISAILDGGDLFGVSEPELVEFRLWDYTTDTEYVLKGTTSTNPGGHIELLPVGKPNIVNTIETLVITGEQLNEAFATNTLVYTATIDGATLPIVADYVIALSDARATVEVDAATNFTDDKVTTITVTAEDGSKKVYTITFNQKSCNATKPTAANVTKCEGDVYVLTAVATGTAKWYADAEKTTFLADGASYTADAAGTYYVANNDVCISETTPVVLTVNAKPVVTFPDVTLCAGDSKKLEPTVAGGVTFAWTGTAAALLDDKSILTPIFKSQGVADYQATITVTDANACVGEATASVTVKASPVVEITALANPLCEGGEPITLAAVPTGGSFSSTVVGVVTPNGVFTPSSAGEVPVVYSYTDQTGCKGIADATISVNAKPTYVISGGGNFCAGSEIPSVVIALTGKAPFALSYSVDGTPSAAVAADNNFVINPTGEGNYELVSLTDDNGCVGTINDTKTISVTQTVAPEMPIAQNVEVCSGTTAILTATGKNIKWYSNETLATLVAEGATLDTLVTTIGDVNFWVTQTDGCESPARKVLLTILSAPTAPTGGSELSVCEGTSNPELSFEGSEVLNWYKDEAKKEFIISAASYTPTVTTAGTHTFYATKKVSECESATGIATLTIKANPEAPKTTGAEICTGSANVEIKAIGASIKWYSEAKAFLADGNSYIPQAAGLYYATQTLNECESDFSATQYVINNNPTASITGPAEVCINATVELVLVPATGGVVSGTGVTENVFDPSVAGVGVHTLTYTYGSGTCKAEDELTITVFETAKPFVASESMKVNGTIPTFALTPKATATWYNSNKEVLISGESFKPEIDASVAPVTHVFYVSVLEKDCQSALTQFTLQVSDCDVDAPTVTDAAIEVCPGTGFPQLTATGTDLTWYANAAHTEILSSENSFIPTKEGTVYVTDKNATCEGPHTIITLSYTSMPSVSFTLPEYICKEAGDVELSDFVNPKGGTFSGTGVTGSIFNAANVTESEVEITYTFTKDQCSVEKLAIAKIQATPVITITDMPANVCASVGEVELSQYVSPSNGIFSGANVDGSNFITATVGVNDLTYTVEVNGCKSSKDFSIEVLQSPAKPAGLTIADVCQDAQSIQLESGYSWYTNSQLSTVAANPFVISNTGLQKLYATKKAGECESEALEVSFNVIPSVTLTVSSVVVGINEIVPNLTAESNATISWYSNANATDLLFSGASYATGKTEAGVYTYYVKAANSKCESAVKAITLTITTCTIAAPIITVSSVEVCKGETVKLTVTNATETVKWYSDAALLNEVSSGNSYDVVSSTVGVNTVYAAQVGTCTSPATSATFTVNAIPVVTLTASATNVTPNDAKVILTGDPVGGVYIGDGLVSNQFDPSTVTSTNTFTFKYTFTSLKGCSASSEVAVKVTVGPTLDFAGLIASIDSAKALVAKVEADGSVGNGADQYPKTAVDALKQAILDAEIAKTNATTQDQIKAADVLLEKAIVTFGLSIGTGQITANDIEIQEVAAMSVGQKVKVVYSYLPQGATDLPTITWSSSLPTIATVDASGEITAVGAGVTVIKATMNGAEVASVTVTVYEAPKVISITLANPSKLVLKTNSTIVSPSIDAVKDFVVSEAGVASVIMGLSVNPNDKSEIVIMLLDPISNASAVKVSYTGTSVVAENGAKLAKFSDMTVITTDASEITSTIKVYPTLTDGLVFIESDEEVSSVSVISLDGKTISGVVENLSTVDLGGNSNGQYIITVITINGDVVSKTITKK
ncbi:MAG: Ig-like domain-containing protein [Bacteroidales bacterium]|nr:Ig-like domain-containing protein [Bacteroidales bacterium]